MCPAEAPELSLKPSVIAHSSITARTWDQPFAACPINVSRACLDSTVPISPAVGLKDHSLSPSHLLFRVPQICFLAASSPSHPAQALRHGLSCPCTTLHFFSAFISCLGPYLMASCFCEPSFCLMPKAFACPGPIREVLGGFCWLLFTRGQIS